MKKLILALFILCILTACSGNADGAAKATEAYLAAMGAKDSAKLSSLSCADWEQQAQMELDSFSAVDIKVEGVACKQTGTDGDTTLVQCQGKLVATYNNEDQEFDLSTRTYTVVQQGGEWLVCGAK
jgi:hypothetical protein